MKVELKTYKFICDKCEIETVLYECDQIMMPTGWTKNPDQQRSTVFDGYINSPYILLGDVFGNYISIDKHYCPQCTEKIEIQEIFE